MFVCMELKAYFVDNLEFLIRFYFKLEKCHVLCSSLRQAGYSSFFLVRFNYTQYYDGIYYGRQERYKLYRNWINYHKNISTCVRRYVGYVFILWSGGDDGIFYSYFRLKRTEMAHQTRILRREWMYLFSFNSIDFLSHIFAKEMMIYFCNKCEMGFVQLFYCSLSFISTVLFSIQNFMQFLYKLSMRKFNW